MADWLINPVKAMADCLISPVKEIPKCILTQCLWPLINPDFNYWWHFDNNIQELRDGIRDLDRKTLHISQKLEDARLRLEVVRPWVEKWLKESTEKLAEALTILPPDDNIPKMCNLLSRYSLGKNAKKTAEEIAKLLNNGDFNPIADPAPPPATASPYHRPTMEFESRKSIEKDIIDSLKKNSVGVIGIFGMGGVGKTTMAQRIGKRVKEENLFDEIVSVTVSQNIDEFKIQEDIAEWLELKLDGKGVTRATTLRTRLMDAKRKIIILDDVWESLRFEDLGIPTEGNSERCKVLLASRSRETFKRIKNKKVFELKILEEEEAWNLFKEQVGECIEDDLALRPLAKDVAAECKGLPIALVTVGLALQDETDKRTWKYSLSKLKEAKPTDLPNEIMTHVYLSLELSYKKLDNHLEKRFFLLCCLFPEDYSIPLEELTWYCMGLQMFDNMSIEEATNKTHALVGKLKNRFLLIDGRDKRSVKMHDVVRDVANYIGSKEDKGFLKSLTSTENSSDDICNWMSVNISNERMEVPVVLRFPKLRLLMLLKWGSNELSDISFEGMKDLNVLSFQNTWIGSLPPTLGSLENLQTLCLFNCEVQNISVIGKLTSLKILCCCECENITELPAEIGSLSDLRLLELNGCRKLQRIPFGVVSSLRRLEELKMRGSFTRWEAKENGKERRNASLTELGSLPNLSCLEIEIPDCTLYAQEISLSLNLVKYYIGIGSKHYYYHREERDYEKAMIFNLPSHIGAVGKWIQMQVRNTEYLSLQGDGSVSNNFNIAEIENLRNLRVENFPTLKKLVETKHCKFHNLKSIHINRCDNLRSLFSVSAARRCLLQLEVLEIQSCDKLEVVFWNEGTDDNTDGCIEFPKLKQLKLDYLPNLTAFCQGLEIKDVSFCNLKSIIIFECDNLRSLFSVSAAARRCLLQLEVLNIIACESMEQVFWNDNTYGCIEFPKLEELMLRRLPNLTAFCQGLEKKDVSFCNLISIEIGECDNLRSLFSVSAARRCLLQLEVLEIEECESMEQVFCNEMGDDNTDGCIIEFPKLKELTLWYLPNLTAFCQGLESIIIKFPNLTRMWIGELPKLNSLSPLSSETLVCHHHTTSSLHFVCNPKVEMGCLKYLTLNNLQNNIRNIWCHQIPNNIFNNLQELTIENMNGIRSLMSISIAKNLVNLKHLQIYNCEEMVEVIERDDDDKLVVDINNLFCTLKQLKMSTLPKLKRFWQWNHTLELPLLKDVSINNCPEMETIHFGIYEYTKYTGDYGKLSSNKGSERLE